MADFIYKDGQRYEFLTRWDTKQQANQTANTWRKRGRKAIVREAPSGYKGYFVYIEEW